MRRDLKSFLKYYRNSLADSAINDITKKETDTGCEIGEITSLDIVKLKEAYQKFYKLLPKRKKDNQEIKYPISVFISPFYLSGKHLHASKTKIESKIYPFWIPAVLKNNGSLIPPEEKKKKPWFLRNTLSPICVNRLNYPIVSSVRKIDKKLNGFEPDYENWDTYLQSCEDFFSSITGECFSKYKLKGFYKETDTCIIKAKETVTADAVLKLYDDIIDNEHESNVLNELIINDELERSIVPKADDFFLNSGHFGQYSNQFSLSTSQRKSVIAFLNQKEGTTLAVNGPPGTGKTTLLQSIVATLLVDSVIKNERPPRIVASSTNNQAITNILDSFGTSDNMISWLPNLSSMGTYMISSSPTKKEEAIKKGYQLLNRTGGKFSGHYYENFYNCEINEIQSYYLSKQDLLDKNTPLTEVINEVRDKVLKAVCFIENALKGVKEVGEVQETYYKFIEIDKKKEELKNIEFEIITIENKKKEILEYRNKLEQYLDSNKFSQFLSFIPSVKNTVKNKNLLFLADAPIEDLKYLSKPTEIRECLVKHLQLIDNDLKEINLILNSHTKILEKVVHAKEKWDNLYAELTDIWNEYLFKQDESLQKAINKEFENVCIAEKVNMILDISYRYEAFVYSKYYWEGKWIEEKKSNNDAADKWLPRRVEFKHMSYITPLFISTFHTLPNYGSFTKSHGNEKLFVPLYDFFDLLIVDEAGQVSPEVGIASFSLAKKALVVGDVYQIEPVWSIAYETVEEGNLSELGILDNYSFNNLKQKGMLCSSGSLMKLAQNASHFSTNNKIKGTFLSEHRRCVDELVAFSNIYIYDNLLVPKVGSSKGKDYLNENNEKLFLPPLSYININGESASKNSSNYNKKEALAVAQWIATHKEHLLSTVNKGKPMHKHKKLKDIIAVVTPFSSQRNEIIKQFRSFEIDSDITVGTVHALQGAEREIVIFSPTYGVNHIGGLFFDSGYNMLNVALTRAKKHFIVIGNMRIFKPKNIGVPSGGLANLLFEKPENELSSSFYYEQKELLNSKNRINTLTKHVKALKKSFRTAKEQLIIISPFISKKAMDSDRLEVEINEAIKRNIKVIVYTDKHLDSRNGELKPTAEEGRDLLIKSGVKLKILDGIHNKAIAIDNNVLIEGSFNWLSAVRDEKNPFCRYEVSQIVVGDEAQNQIGQLKNDLEKITE